MPVAILTYHRVARYAEEKVPSIPDETVEPETFFAHLKALKKGGDFDRAYVDHEVAYHQAVIDAIDKSLVPNAKNAELKDLLVKSRPAWVGR